MCLSSGSVPATGVNLMAGPSVRGCTESALANDVAILFC